MNPLAGSSRYAGAVAYVNPTTGLMEAINGLGGVAYSMSFAWSPSLLMPVMLSVDPSGNLNVASSGGGGGGAVTIADGADVTQGALADSANTTGTTGTISGKLRGLVTLTGNLITALGSPLQAGGAVSVSNFPGTQPISGSVSLTGTLPAFAATPTFNLGTLNGAATSALQTSGNATLSSMLTALGSPLQAGGSVSVSNFPATQPVSGTFWQATQPISGSISFTAPQHVIVDSSASIAVTGPLTDTQLRASAVPISAASLPLPSGAATAAKQPALGTAGSASADVLSIQGVASMTALKVDGSGVTQPVSGTFWQGTQPVSGTFWQATQPVSAASLPLPSGAATSALQTTGNTSLTTINTTLGSPFQAGGSIGNTTFAATQSGTWTVGISAAQTIATTNAGTFAVQAAQSGAWNITNISGTISLPTGASTSALQTTGNTALTTINTTLGSPFQAGGSIGNASFGISGALPAFAATPTVNLGTLNGASTAANQATEIASLANLDVALSTRLKPADTLAGVTTVGTITNPVGVTGVFYQATQPVSVASLPLPANATAETGGNLEANTALLRVLIQEQRLVRQLVAAAAGGFIPVPEYPTFL